MRLQFSLVVSTLIYQALGQTPPGTSPATNQTLNVTYGTTKVTPGINLPISVPTSLPTITRSNVTSNQTYHLFLLDLSISTATQNLSALNASAQLPLAAGIAANRTTRLHYWQTGIQFSSNGSIVNTTTPIAYYQPPGPPAGDIPHTYAFYLFQQPAGFQTPTDGNIYAPANINKGSNRVSFSLQKLVGQPGVGSLVGANYFLVQNTTGSGSASATGTAGGAKPTASTAFKGVAGRNEISLVEGIIAGAFALLCMV